jgi:hypothetical protein
MNDYLIRIELLPLLVVEVSIELLNITGMFKVDEGISFIAFMLCVN